MADAADPANHEQKRSSDVVRPSDFTTEHLIEFFDEVAGKLVRADLRSERLVDALKLVAIRTEILRRDQNYAGPERRGPARPWSEPNRRAGEPRR